MLRLAIAALFLTASSASVAADDEWHRYTASQSGDTVYVMLTNASSGPTPRIWIKFEMPASKRSRTREIKQLEKYNCANETSLTLSLTAYAADGTVVDSDTRMDNPYSYEPVIPGSVGAGVMKLVCNKSD